MRPERPDDVMEIRLHGRGGQGGVTCAKILAALYAERGKAVQTFGDYAGERAGAPVRAFTRVSDQPITNRNKVYRPHHLVVLDPTLLGPDVLAGLPAGGTVLVNTPLPPTELGAAFGAFRVVTVDATAIARRHRIGTRSVVIVNTTLAGAFARAFDLPLSLVESVFDHLGYAKNFAAARDAYEAVRVRPPVDAALPFTTPATTALPGVVPLVEQLEGPRPTLKTGSWRTQAPRYVRALAPCTARCPAGNDVVGFIQALARGGEQAAAIALTKSSPFPGVCGRVCPAPCMEGCNRKGKDGAVNVRGLERWIADQAVKGAELPYQLEPHVTLGAPRRIAIVGSGPAGLSAARMLALYGHRVTVLEREAALGGVLRTGIPAYRLPRQVLDREVAAILDLGVEARCEEKVDADRVALLPAEYDAVILATGLQRLRSVDGPRGQLDGVEQGIRFLHRFNLEGGGRVEGHVVVLGGGNTAMDCARSAVRSGASKVTVVYRRSREEMPANADEIQQALDEGVEFVFLAQPVGYAGTARVEAVEIAEVELGAPDASGRRAPIVTGRTRQIACDHVLLALGQSADLSLLPQGWALRGGQLFAGEKPQPVFAAGDVATAAGTVAHAIGDGKRVAEVVLRWLGHDLEPTVRPDPATAVKASEVKWSHFAPSAPAHEREAPPEQRMRSVDLEVGLGLQSAEEAKRCLSCGDCTGCDTCLVYCPEGIIRREGDRYAVDLAYCKGCGICVAECPRKGMEMVTA